MGLKLGDVKVLAPVRNTTPNRGWRFLMISRRKAYGSHLWIEIRFSEHVPQGSHCIGNPSGNTPVTIIFPGSFHDRLSGASGSKAIRLNSSRMRLRTRLP